MRQAEERLAVNANMSSTGKPGRYKPGQSGNPGGRPKGLTWLRDLARKHTEVAITTLVECMANKDGKVRVAAANAILDRGWGKPEQVVKAKITHDELYERIARIAAEAGEEFDARAVDEAH
jgi:hypothetical protein